MRRVYRKKEQEKNNNLFHSNHPGRFGLQPKLQVGKPGDKYEEEADKVADKIANNNNAGQPFFAPATRQDLQKSS